MFTSRVMVIKMSNNGFFCIFWHQQKMSHNLDTQFKCTEKIFLNKHDLELWPQFLSTIWTLSRVYSRKWGYGCNFSVFFTERSKTFKKGQNIWKFEQKCIKGQAIACIAYLDTFNFCISRNQHKICVRSLNKKLCSLSGFGC